MKRLLLSITLALTAAIGFPGAYFLAAQPAFACDGVTLSSPITKSNCVSKSASGGVIFDYLRMIIQFMSGIIGSIIVLMIVIGGVQYIIAAGNPGAVKAAKDRITNAITGLVLFMLMFAILNFLVPGGLIG